MLLDKTLSAFYTNKKNSKKTTSLSPFLDSTLR